MGDVRKTQEQHEKEVYEVWGNDVTVLGEYKGNRVKIKYFCHKCNRVFEKDPYNLINRKQGCTLCGKGARLGRDKAWFQGELDKKYPNAYEVIEYNGKKKKCKLKKLSCNHIIEPIADNILRYEKQNPPCAICYGHLQLEYLEIKKDIEKDNKYTLLTNEETYLNGDLTQGKVKICHNECGCVYDVLLKNWRSGNRCPDCNRDRYKGEKAINKYLTENNIDFIDHYTGFKDCKNINVLEFDFYLPDYNAVIEFDGRFHFEPMTDSEYSLNKFKGQQKCDKIKNKYCKDNNIPILRIPYTEFQNINIKLDEFIKELDSTTIDSNESK